MAGGEAHAARTAEERGKAAVLRPVPNVQPGLQTSKVLTTLWHKNVLLLVYLSLRERRSLGLQPDSEGPRSRTL